MIEQAYTHGAELGLAVWAQDEAGPYQAIPQPGTRWQPAISPARYPHEHLRHGTAKLLTLFHPATGHVRVRGVSGAPNAVLHAWLEAELTSVLAALPPHERSVAKHQRLAAWERWQAGLSVRFTLPQELPALRLLLILDNLAGHKTPTFVLWLVAHGIMPLYTPLSGSWLNMAESIQRILASRALAGHIPTSPHEIMRWLEAAATGWNANPTPFICGGPRHARRERSRQRRHALAGSGAYTTHPIHRRPTPLEQWRHSCQVTH